MRAITTSFLVIVILLGITFACLNATPVEINYYIGVHYLPLSLLLTLSLTLGALIGFFIGLMMYCRVKRKNRHLRKRLNLVEKEIANIRSLPLQENR